jgi:hypothetical protein
MSGTTETVPSEIDERGNPYAQLGPKFWVPWSVAMASVLAAFAGVMWAVFPFSESLPGMAAGGTAVIAFTLALIALSMLPMRVLQKKGIEGHMRPAYRRYTARFLPAMFGYVIFLMGAIYYWKEAHPEGLTAWLVGLAPSLPLLFAIRAITLLPREEEDEYLRDRTYRAYALATGGMLAICSIWGFLDLFEVVPHVQLWAAFPIWAVCLAIAQCMPHLGPKGRAA